MHTPAILAAKHAALGSGVGLGAIPVMGWASLDGVAVSMLLAGVGFAAVSSRRVQSCPLQATPGDAGPAAASRAAAGRLARFTQRVDEVLTGMLSDDPHKMTPAPATAHLAARRAGLADERFPAASCRHWRSNSAMPTTACSWSGIPESRSSTSRSQTSRSQTSRSQTKASGDQARRTMSHPPAVIGASTGWATRRKPSRIRAAEPTRVMRHHQRLS